MAERPDEPETTKAIYEIPGAALRQAMDSGVPLIISATDFASATPGGTGGMVMGGGQRVFPDDKPERELAVTALFAKVLRAAEPTSPELTGLRLGDDPPDVVARRGERPVGIEVGELRATDRSRDVARVASLKARVLALLDAAGLGASGMAVLIQFKAPLAGGAPLEAPAPQRERLATTVAEAVISCIRDGVVVDLPEPLRAARCVGASNLPAMRTQLICDADLHPVLFDTAEQVASSLVEKKTRCVTSGGEQWLLLWCRTPDFSYMFPMVAEAIRRAIGRSPNCPYDRIYLLDARLEQGEQLAGYGPFEPQDTPA